MPTAREVSQEQFRQAEEDVLREIFSEESGSIPAPPREALCWSVSRGYMNSRYPTKVDEAAYGIQAIFLDRAMAIKFATKLPTMHGNKYEWRPCEMMDEDGLPWYWYGPDGDYVAIKKHKLFSNGQKLPEPSYLEAPKREPRSMGDRWEEL